MAKINRYSGNLKAFAADALSLERTVFGDTTEADDLDSNITSEFLRGWGIVGVNENPTKQDFNGLAYTISQLIAYLHQVGISEWDDEQEFAEYGFCIGSDGRLYQSLVAENIGNDPTTDGGTNWLDVFTAANIDYDNSDSGLTATDTKAALDELKNAINIDYDNTDSGLSATNVKTALDELRSAVLFATYFAKTDRDSVAWTKTGNDTAETSQKIFVEVAGSVLEIDSGTSISMPTLTAGTDYAIWVAPDGTLEADESYSVAPTAGGRRIGGFHYAPGGNASFAINAGDGNTTPQINEYSFHDLKWRPAAPDPRGLTLVGDGAFWCGIYHLAQDHLAGPPHRHGVSPARDGNPPQLINGEGNYPDAQPMNIFEVLAYHGFRSPRVEDFQLLAFGTKEEASRGSDPVLTGLSEDNVGTENPDEVFTSHWGVIQSTGVIRSWSNDSILSTTDETLPNPSRGDRFRVSRFATLGGTWVSGSGSGSRYVGSAAAAVSGASVGSRGRCDHLILD